MTTDLLEGEYVPSADATTRGQARNPSWFHNLVAHPTVQLQDGPDRRLMTARVAEGAERENWLTYTDELYPFFAGLRARAIEAGNREVPLVLLEPTES
jgi:deazaflavin-dependent oxidoreductase (nitroreductase family)